MDSMILCALLVLFGVPSDMVEPASKSLLIWILSNLPNECIEEIICGQLKLYKVDAKNIPLLYKVLQVSGNIGKTFGAFQNLMMYAIKEILGKETHNDAKIHELSVYTRIFVPSNLNSSEERKTPEVDTKKENLDKPNGIKITKWADAKDSPRPNGLPIVDKPGFVVPPQNEEKHKKSGPWEDSPKNQKPVGYSLRSISKPDGTYVEITEIPAESHPPLHKYHDLYIPIDQTVFVNAPNFNLYITEKGVVVISERPDSDRSEILVLDDLLQIDDNPQNFKYQRNGFLIEFCKYFGAKEIQFEKLPKERTHASFKPFSKVVLEIIQRMIDMQTNGKEPVLPNSVEVERYKCPKIPVISKIDA